MPFERTLEGKILDFGRGFLADIRAKPSDTFWDKMVSGSGPLADPALKTQLLRLIDVLPVVENDRQTAEHVGVYLGDPKLSAHWPQFARWGMRFCQQGIAASLVARGARMACRKMARKFIAGRNVEEIEPRLRQMHEEGFDFTLDLLGEASTGEAMAKAYQQTYLQTISELGGRMSEWPVSAPSAGRRPQLHLSIKASGLYSQMRPVNVSGCVAVIKDRLRPIFSAAKAAGAFITLDVEQYDFRTITIRAFTELLTEPDLRSFTDAGIAVQAYLRDTSEVIASLIDWAKVRGAPVTIRLVRGAYWDYEVSLSAQNSWPPPVWLNKAQTDSTYEKCLELLLRNFPTVRTAIATHNLRSICAGAVLADSMGVSSDDYEFQMLYGMLEGAASALVSRGRRVRIYTPFGPLLPGMAYLVRRLMENASNDSMLRATAHQGSVEDVLAPPQLPPTESNVPPAATHTQSQDGFVNIAPRRFSIPEQHAAFETAIQRVSARLPMDVVPMVEGRPLNRVPAEASMSPSHTGVIVGRIGSAQVQDVESAVAAAGRALAEWKRYSVEQRAAMLNRAADILADRRDELASWQILEAGKPWAEADADVCEAIDHIRYAAFQARRTLAPVDLSTLGESNHYIYEPRGIAAIISPWNFPLAISAGMTAAALAAGNTVIMKPAPQTPVNGFLLAEALIQTGVPAGVMNFLPGGDKVGKALVQHPDVALVAFTGSEAVGRRIHLNVADPDPGQNHFKHVIAEMGGKNPIIVDDDADLDLAVPEIIASAFGYAGQKCSACSRLILHDSIYDRLMDKLIDAVAAIDIGPAEDPRVFMGPVIDAEAKRRLEDAIRRGCDEARLIFKSSLPTDLDGFYVPPAIFADVPVDGFLAQEELFGPVLGVFRVKSMQEAIQLANRTRYGLTAGVMSRHPVHIEQACRELEAGNIYVNRRITGAVVNRQPFGGMKLSSLGSKAGGPDYLKQFVQTRVITENTIRHGFVPPQEFNRASTRP
jgi:RHH-type proline utilization regulon transcriptional repressor/proline dehydrogenase/delta 1-pyrroline-5-carboxylate dehydrogenase